MTIEELFEAAAADVDTDREPFAHEAFWERMNEECAQ